MQRTKNGGKKQFRSAVYEKTRHCQNPTERQNYGALYFKRAAGHFLQDGIRIHAAAENTILFPFRKIGHSGMRKNEWNLAGLDTARKADWKPEFREKPLFPELVRGNKGFSIFMEFSFAGK